MLIFDLETDGLLDELTRIHCIHIIDDATGEAYSFNDGWYVDGSPAPRDGSIDDGIKMLEDASGVAGHNIIGFDIPAIQKLYPDFPTPKCAFDTLIAARVAWPNLLEIDAAAVRKGKRPRDWPSKLTGSHKLEAWGIRLGVMKAMYDGGWEVFTREMDDYGRQDPVATRALYHRILAKNYAESALRLEFDVARIIFYQERHGFLFNSEDASDLERDLRGRLAELGDILRDTFQPWVEPVMKGGKPFIFVPKRDNAKLGYTAGVGVPKFKTVSFNPASRHHIANRMKALFGWEPVEFTDNGQPKVDETTLNGLDYPEAKLLVEYLTVEKRLGQLAEGKQAWLKKVRADGRIHGRVNTVGAVTRRMTHSDPNMAQVPAVRAPYGARCRALFMVSTGMKLVGCDAEGLELRMLAHYMARTDEGRYADTVVNGSKDDGTDVHTVNQRLIGLNSRDSAKTWIYAYLYGAGNFKLGSIVYADYTDEQRALFNAKHPPGDARDKAFVRIGMRGRKRIEEGLPALGELQDKVKRLSKAGYLKTLDGGLLKVRSAHAALNTLLQGGGAVLMKMALVIMERKLLAEGFTVVPLTGVYRRADGVQLGFVANIHDEFQMEVSEAYAEIAGRLAADAIREAGEAFELRCPTAGAYQIGNNWADSH